MFVVYMNMYSTNVCLFSLKNFIASLWFPNGFLRMFSLHKLPYRKTDIIKVAEPRRDENAPAYYTRWIWIYPHKIGYWVIY